MKQYSRDKSVQSTTDKAQQREQEVDPGILDVMREEQSRGKRPVDIAEKRRQEQQRQMVRKIYRHGTEQQLRELLQTWGFSKAEIEERLSIFRQLRQE